MEKSKHIFTDIPMQNTVHKELLELIQQTTSLLKSNPHAVLPASKEVYTYFTPPKNPVVPEKKRAELKVSSSIEKPATHIPSSRWPAIRSTLQKIAPYIKLLDTIPDDLQAHKIANAWSRQIGVVIIAGPASNEELLFLKNLARAIQDRLTAVKLISGIKLEKEKNWLSFFEKNIFKMLIIAHSAQKYPTLMSCYQKEKNQLASIPVILLYHIETYKQPDQKTALWESLCQIVTPAVLPV